MEEKDTQRLRDVANILRIHSIRMTDASKSGHPTSCSSMAEIMACLFFSKAGLRLDGAHPKNLANDKFVLSKGHAAPILYAAWAQAGLISRDQLLTLRKIDSDLEGHPTPRLPWVDVATGSLGQGLCSIAGMAYASKYFEKRPQTAFFCLMGDGEVSEGSVWEAMNFCSHYELDNVVAIIDMNRLAQSEPTMFQHKTELLGKRCEAFGFETLIVDGHNIEEVTNALLKGRDTREGKPHAIIAKTFKGKGFKDIEDKLGFHGKPLGGASAAVIQDLEEVIQDKSLLQKDAPTLGINELKEENKGLDQGTIELSGLDYKKGEALATRNAFGNALRRIGADSRIVSVDADVQNSTMSIFFAKEYPDRQVQGYIAESNAVGVATGIATRGYICFVSTFAAFFTRASDFIRMCGISQVPVKFVGSHVGVSIGEDGTSQMGLEDIALFRTVPGSIVFYPSDAVSAERAVALAANYQGIAYIRTTRGGTPIIYENQDKDFAIGKSRVVRKSDKDKLTLITGGITLPEALKAADELDVPIRVVDIFSIKPLDSETIIKNAAETEGRILVVEDHYPEGGIRDAVNSVLCNVKNTVVESLAVREIPRSGKPGELLSKYGLDSESIKNKVKEMMEKY